MVVAMTYVTESRRLPWWRRCGCPAIDSLILTLGALAILNMAASEALKDGGWMAAGDMASGAACAGRLLWLAWVAPRGRGL